MKFNFKKVVACLMALALLSVAFVSCAQSGDTKDKKFVIGGTGPLTGDAAIYGTSVQQGAKLALEEINAAGGLNGFLFELNFKDDKAGAEEAATAYDQLMDAGMQISIGSTTSGACLSFASKAVEDNLFFITPSASNADVIKNSDAFRVCFGDPDQGVLAADKIVNDYKFTKVGCIYDTSDDYSAGIYKAFEEEMKTLNVEFITQSFDSENNKDFSTQVDALKDCEVIFLPIYYTEAGLIARACSNKGCAALLFGCDGLDGVVGQIDETVTNKIQYITPFDVNSDDEVSAKFVENYKAKYGTEPDQFAADAYDAVKVIFAAMQKAGVDDVNISASDLCEKVVAAITDASFTFKGATGEMKWNATGACDKTPIIVEVGK